MCHMMSHLLVTVLYNSTATAKDREEAKNGRDEVNRAEEKVEKALEDVEGGRGFMWSCAQDRELERRQRRR